MYGIKNSLEIPKQVNVNQFNVDLDIKSVEPTITFNSQTQNIEDNMDTTTLEQEPTITFNSQTGISMVANEIAHSIQLEDKIDDLPESNYIKFKGDLLSEYLKYRKECRKSKMEYDNYVLVDLDDGEGFVHQLVNVNSIDSGDVKNINTGATQHITCISRDWKVKCNVIPAKNKNVLDTLIQVASNLYVNPNMEQLIQVS